MADLRVTTPPGRTSPLLTGQQNDHLPARRQRRREAAGSLTDQRLAGFVSPFVRRLLLTLPVLCITGAAAPAAAAPSAKAAVHQILAAPSDGQVSAAAARLKYLGQEAFAIRVLLRAWAEGITPEQQRSVAQALVLLEHPSAIASFIDFTHEADPVLRMAGAEGLGRTRLTKQSHAPRVKALLPLLQDGSFGVRREAARSLERIGAKGAGAALVDAAAGEGEPELRVAMLSAAGTSGEAKIIPALRAFGESSSESTRFAANRALCRLGAEEGLAAARALLTSATSAEKRQGIALLEGASLRDSSTLLEPLLLDEDRAAAAAAARTLHQNGDARMLAWLVLSSDRSSGETKLIYEKELERLRVSDEQRKAILRAVAREKQ